MLVVAFAAGVVSTVPGALKSIAEFTPGHRFQRLPIDRNRTLRSESRSLRARVLGVAGPDIDRVCGITCSTSADRPAKSRR